MQTHKFLSDCGKAGALKRWGSQSTEQRFWKFVDKKGEDECWNWKGNHARYGMFQMGKKGKLAHRLAYKFCKGNIPPGMCVCHSCDNGLCCNPKHLWLGTHKENMDDMSKKKRYKIPDNTGRKHVSKYSPEFLTELIAYYETHNYSAKEIALQRSMSWCAVREILRKRHTFR